MKKVLITWVGRTDINASESKPEAGEGPIGQAVAQIELNEINLLCDCALRDSDQYLKWLRSRTKAKLIPHRVKLSGPTNF
jgi:uncharacterized ferritin-like protein (DUF455 family)